MSIVLFIQLILTSAQVKPTAFHYTKVAWLPKGGQVLDLSLRSTLFQIRDWATDNRGLSTPIHGIVHCDFFTETTSAPALNLEWVQG